LNAWDSLQGFHDAHHGTFESNQKGTFPAGVEVTGKYGFHPRFPGDPFVHQSLHDATELLAKLLPPITPRAPAPAPGKIRLA
jgi:hypothetical protein